MAPGVYAKRVAENEDREEHAVMEPDLMLTCIRIIEMAFESVPGSIYQSFVVLRDLRNGAGYKKSVLVSIALSALSTGFSAATISFE